MSISKGPGLLNALLKVKDFSHWRNVARLHVGFDVFHPQGMLKFGNTFYLSTVDKRFGRGFLFTFVLEGGNPSDRHQDLSNARIRKIAEIDVTQGPNHKRYHPGGLDWLASRQEIWIPMAEYARRTSSTVVAYSPKSKDLRIVGEVKDHVGALICDDENNLLRLTDWDTEGIYTAPIAPDGKLTGYHKGWSYQKHMGYYSNPIFGRHGRFAYQDCKSIGEQHAICGGVRRGLFWQMGVIDIIRFGEDKPENFKLVRRIWAPGVANPFGTDWFAIPLTRNPMTLEQISDDTIRFYFMPHDGAGSCLFIYDAPIDPKK